MGVTTTSTKTGHAGGPDPRVGAAVYSRDGARVGTIARVYRAAGPEPAAPSRCAFLLEPGPVPTVPCGQVCLPASAIARVEKGRVMLALTQEQLVA